MSQLHKAARTGCANPCGEVSRGSTYTARTAPFMPGASPPEVRTPILLFLPSKGAGASAGAMMGISVALGECVGLTGLAWKLGRLMMGVFGVL